MVSCVFCGLVFFIYLRTSENVIHFSKNNVYFYETTLEGWEQSQTKVSPTNGDEYLSKDKS